MEISIVSPVTPVLPRFPAAYEAETPRVTESARRAEPMVALDDGGVAIGLDPDDGLSLAPQWLAWMEWVDERQPLLVDPVVVVG